MKMKLKGFLIDVLNISDTEGIPYMGWQYEENIFWPEENQAGQLLH